jgi:hypothetical protein
LLPIVEQLKFPQVSPDAVSVEVRCWKTTLASAGAAAQKEDTIVVTAATAMIFDTGNSLLF